MKVLVLSPYPESLNQILASSGDDSVVCEMPTTETSPEPSAFGLAVSYGYRHLIRGDVLDAWQNRLINLHVSMLPWNRGADPNFWAAHNGTPGGVSIHYIDAGIDTGDLIAQQEIPFQEGDTLASSYDRLQRRMIELFRDTWPSIRAGTAPRIKQQGEGSHHRARDKDDLMAKLPLGWETPVAEVARLAHQDIER